MIQMLVISTLFVSSVTIGHPQGIQDGIYRISPDPTEVSMELDDQSIYLGELVTDNLGTVKLHSQTNDNAQFHLTMESCGPVNEGQAPFHSAVLVIGNRGFRLTGGSRSNGEGEAFSMLSAAVPDLNSAEHVAEHLGIDDGKREHPGHRLLAVWKPVQTSYSPDEPVLVELELTNVGDVPLIFMDGGQQRGARNNQFGFACFHNMKPVPDVGDPMNFGGLARTVVLKKGETFTKSIDLRGWYELNEAGSYQLRCSFQLMLQKSEQAYDVAWEDYATGHCLVTMQFK